MFGQDIKVFKIFQNSIKSIDKKCFLEKGGVPNRSQRKAGMLSFMLSFCPKKAPCNLLKMEQILNLARLHFPQWAKNLNFQPNFFFSINELFFAFL